MTLPLKGWISFQHTQTVFILFCPLKYVFFYFKLKKQKYNGLNTANGSEYTVHV